MKMTLEAWLARHEYDSPEHALAFHDDQDEPHPALCSAGCSVDSMYETCPHGGKSLHLGIQDYQHRVLTGKPDPQFKDVI